MKVKKIWEIEQKDNYIYFNNLEDFFQYLSDNNWKLNFIIKDSYTPGDKVETRFDNIALRNNYKIIYTDQTHPIALSKDSFNPSMISKSFYEVHKEELKNYVLKKIDEKFNNNEVYLINIPDFVFNDKLLEKIIKNKNNDQIDYYYIECVGNNKITEIQKQIIRDNFLSFNARYRTKNNEQISNKYLIYYYTKHELEKITTLDLYIPLKDAQIDNLKYVNENAKISFFIDSNDKQDDEYYLRHIKNIFKKIQYHNHKYNIEIKIKNRKILNDSNILKNIPENIDLYILNNLYEYDIDTYLNEEAKIEKIIAPIREAKLSPLEKYMAVYNIVKKFKPYKENNDNPELSRQLRYILDYDNDYIVCVGFSNLISELLNRIDIPNMYYGLNVDASYNKGYTKEEKTLSYVGHQRNLVKLDDPKYNIHGYYLVDSTWDNYIDKDIYLNSLLTFDRKKEAKKLESLENIDLLLDIHNFDEFKTKINCFLKREINSIIYNHNYKTYEMKEIINIEEKYSKLINNCSNKNEKITLVSKKENEINEIKKDAYIQAYRILAKCIIDILENTDKEKYNLFFEEYYQKIKDITYSIEEIENVLNDMLLKYFKYITPLVNNKIAFKDIIIAAGRSKKIVEGYSNEELREWLNNVFKENNQINIRDFPYIYEYDKNNNVAYLKDNYKSIDNRKM